MLLLNITATLSQHMYTCQAWWNRDQLLTKMLTIGSKWVSLLYDVLQSIGKACYVTWSLGRFWWGYFRTQECRQKELVFQMLDGSYGYFQIKFIPGIRWDWNLGIVYQNKDQQNLVWIQESTDTEATESRSMSCILFSIC